jgi:hypothetical protein
MKKLVKYYFLLLHSITIFAGGIFSKTITIKNAIEENNIEKIKHFLKKGLSENDKTEALHLAILKNNIPIIQTLLDAGISPDNNIVGITPLHIATREGHPEIVELLLCYGAHPKRDKQEFTPFHHSIMTGQLPCTEFFLTTPIPSFFSPVSPFKSAQKINESKDRIITFLLCLKRKYPDFPKDLKFQILSLMPSEIFSQKFLKAMLEKYPSDFEVYMRYCPQKWLIPATKGLQQEKIFENILTNHIMSYAQGLCSKKIKVNSLYEIEPYHFTGKSNATNKDLLVHAKIIELLDPKNDTKRKELIAAHILKLKNE